MVNGHVFLKERSIEFNGAYFEQRIVMPTKITIVSSMSGMSSFAPIALTAGFPELRHVLWNKITINLLIHEYPPNAT